MVGDLLKQTQSISGFEKCFSLRTKLKCTIAPIKLWTHQGNANEALYGLTFKVIKVLVKLPLGRSLKNQEEKQMVYFLDSDSD